MISENNYISQILSNFYAKQAHLIDTGQHAAWAKTFQQNGEFCSPTYGTTAVGFAKLVEISEKFQGDAKRAEEKQRHIVQNIWVEESDSKSALVRSYLTIVAVQAGSSEVRILRIVTIVDEFAKEIDEWLIKRREVVY